MNKRASEDQETVDTLTLEDALQFTQEAYQDLKSAWETLQSLGVDYPEQMDQRLRSIMDRMGVLEEEFHEYLSPGR